MGRKPRQVVKVGKHKVGENYVDFDMPKRCGQNRPSDEPGSCSRRDEGGDMDGRD